ncbi:FAD-dependent oxidoreductase [Cryomorphaceae bacterium 1068]|nr:FAD-dependent oxidoreductase [Cryomorphaceae bacterium 1068]
MKNETQYDVIIVGAGVAGLVAAMKCEEAGCSVLIIESDTEVGGRVQTDTVDGYTLERGFQVLIDTYEKAKEILDFEALELKRFEPGAKIFDDRGSFSIADPTRKIAALPSTALSRVGSLSDKIKMLNLSKQLQTKKLKEIFEGDRQTTLDYLKDYGFSARIIKNFFRPFFGGIFLERDLVTDAAMFRFVFRNFSKGSACIPAKGMGEIPKQIKAKLKSTEIRLNTKVIKVNQDPSVELEDGSLFKTKKIIIASSPDKLLTQMDNPISWKHTTTMYFSGENSLPSMTRTIGLDARPSSSVNNYARHDEVVPQSAPPNRSLWSVTVRGNESPQVVKTDLAKNLNIDESQLEFLKEYKIKQALPTVDRPALSIPAEQTQITEHIHLAGDYLTNASIDGAMRAGENAAKAITETLEVIV